MSRKSNPILRLWRPMDFESMVEKFLLYRFTSEWLLFERVSPANMVLAVMLGNAKPCSWDTYDSGNPSVAGLKPATSLVVKK